MLQYDFLMFTTTNYSFKRGAIMFQDKIKNLRESKGLSQQKLAEELNISRSTIANYESGVRQPRTKDDWLAIANYFNVTVGYLMDETGENTDVKTIPYDGSTNITMDDFTYAMYNESRTLTDSEKQIILNLARQLNEQKDFTEQKD